MRSQADGPVQRGQGIAFDAASRALLEVIEGDWAEAGAHEFAHGVADGLHHAAHQAVAALVHDDLNGRDVAFRIVDTYGDITTVEIVVHEGRNRLVRRMMEAVGYPVRELVRTGFGPISLDHLKQGTTRRVKGNALTALYGAVGL